MPEDIKELLNQLISSPKLSQIQMDFDLNRKVFILSSVIYQTRTPLPLAVREYVETRRDHKFKPHSTFFVLTQENTVALVQEIPFLWGLSFIGTRPDLLAFFHLAKKCHRMLYEIALEETCKSAFSFDSD